MLPDREVRRIFDKYWQKRLDEIEEQQYSYVVKYGFGKVFYEGPSPVQLELQLAPSARL